MQQCRGEKYAGKNKQKHEKKQSQQLQTMPQAVVATAPT